MIDVKGFFRLKISSKSFDFSSQYSTYFIFQALKTHLVPSKAKKLLTSETKSILKTIVEQRQQKEQGTTSIFAQRWFRPKPQNRFDCLICGCKKCRKS